VRRSVPFRILSKTTLAAGLVLALSAAVAAVPQPHASAATPSAPFAGVGTWVSIYAGDAVWNNPERHVRRMHERGVNTLYLQTASSSRPLGTNLYRPAKLARFLHAAHARQLRVVAWYLPPLRRVAREHARAMAAINFRTSRGQRFDAFALDIEPSATTPSGPLRNDNLYRLSRRIRASVGGGYNLGAIIPSPEGMEFSPRFWPRFPYATIGRFYDAVLPMSYHTYRVSGAAATYDYTTDNVAALRDRLGPDFAIHVIGGDAGRSSRRETAAFVRACSDAGIAGASLWHYGSYGGEDWQEMARLVVARTGVAPG
jgi:hypothetical protein